MKIKKLSLVVLVFALLLSVSGCGRKIELDLDKISTNVDKLTSESFYIQGVQSKVEDKDNKYFTNLEDVYDYDFKKTFGFDGELVSEYSVRMNKKTKEMYAVLKASEGNDDKLTSAMISYFKKLEKNKKKDIVSLAKNRLEKTIGDYHVYILAKEKQEEIFDLIKESKEPIFGAIQAIDDEMLKNLYDIDSDMVESYLIKTPVMITQSSGYYIIKPAKGQTKAVKEKMADYMEKLEKQWETYLPDQYDRVKNRLEVTHGDYLIYIISRDNDRVLEEIKKYELD